MIAAPRHALVSFGTFEVDLSTGEIRKAGLRVRLQGQPFRVLAALLAQPGEIVTREQLQHEIWGDNTTIDFERGIATAINKIRDALGDSAENPVFIETLAKRGYRFIAPVVEWTPPPSSTPDETVSPPVIPPRPAERPQFQPPASNLPETLPAAPAPALQPTPSPAPAAPVPRTTGTLLSTLLVLSCALAVLGISLTLYTLLRSPAPIRPPRIQQITTSGVVYNGPPNNENQLKLVTDGARIYTSFLVGGRSQLSSLNLGGTVVQALNIPDELGTISVADISRDGSRLLVIGQNSRDSEQPLWVVPTVGGSAARVGAVLAHDAAWMPNGDSVLFASGNQLGVADLDGNVETTYPALPGRPFWPRWSPDGKTLRFTLLDPISHTSSLWQLNPATHNAERLAIPELTGTSLCCGSWTPDGRTYVFQASDTEGTNIWSIDGGRPRHLQQLTNGPLHFGSPLPDYENQTVYFVGFENPEGDRVYDEKLRQFVSAPQYLSDASKVMYSRDSQWVAWTDTTGHLWRARASDGSGRLRLTQDDLEVFLAQWSPDGQQLVVMARRPGKTWQIYTVSASGGEVRLLLGDRRNLADPDWSGDGRFIVFGRQAELMGKETGPDLIQVLDLSTHAVRSLPGSENLFSPRWSPDGRWITALSLDQTRVLLYDVQTGVWKTLFTGSAADPVWSRDSQAIFIHAFAGANSGIMRLPLSGAPQLVANPAKLGLPSDSYRFSGITPTGAPIVQPGIGTGNLYSVRLAR